MKRNRKKKARGRCERCWSGHLKAALQFYQLRCSEVAVMLCPPCWDYVHQKWLKLRKDPLMSLPTMHPSWIQIQPSPWGQHQQQPRITQGQNYYSTWTSGSTLYWPGSNAVIVGIKEPTSGTW